MTDRATGRTHDQHVALAPSAVADAAPAAPLGGEDLRPLLDLVADPLYVVDRQWRFRFVNRAAASAWRTTPEALVGRSMWSVHPQMVGSYPYRHLLDVMRERRATLVDAFSPALASRVEASVAPFGDGLVIYHRDVTRLRADEEAQRALDAERSARERAEELAGELTQARELAESARRAAERAHARAEAAARAKSDFLATMSHELRTPINAITGYAQLLELGVAGPVTDAQREYLARLHGSGEHLLVLVNDVLDLARIEAGRMAIAHDHTFTDRVVAAALGIVAPHAAARSIRLVDRATAACVAFVGDEHRVRQILVNLLSNAVKFTAPGGTVTIECGLEAGPVAGVAMASGSGTTAEGGRPRGRMTVFRVTDTGIGIVPEHQARIFEPFVQVDGSRTRTAGGTGLGLAISARLARLMGGELTVDSTPGVGSTFSLWLQTPETVGAPRRAPVDDAAVAPAVAASAAAVAGLGAVGVRLREHLGELLESYVAHLRADPLLEPARDLGRTQLENHALTFLADVVQSLLAIEESGGVETALLQDSRAIQELVAFRHGEQRHRLGWTDAQLVREFHVLATEIEACVRRRTPGEPDACTRAIAVLHRFVDRACEASVRGYRQAARTAPAMAADGAHSSGGGAMTPG